MLRSLFRPTCRAEVLFSGPRAEVTLQGSGALVSLDSVVRPEHGLDSIRSPTSSSEMVASTLVDALLSSDSPPRPVPLCENSGFIDPTSDYSTADQPDELIDLFMHSAPVSYTHLTLPTNREV